MRPRTRRKNDQIEPEPAI